MAYRFDKTRNSHDEYTTWDVINGEGASVATLTREVCTSLIPPAGVARGDVLWFAEGCGEIDITVDIPTGSTFNAAKIATVGALCDAREEAAARDLRNVLARRKRLRSLANELSNLAHGVPMSESLRSIGGVSEALCSDAVDDPSFANETALTMASLAYTLNHIINSAMDGEASIDGYR